MSNKVHTVAPGDTFETLSTRYYGDPSGAGRIQKANPGSTAGLVPGTPLVIPAEPGGSFGTESTGLVVRIAGVSFRHIESISITRNIDAPDTVEIIAPQAETAEYRELIRPLTFHDLEIADDGVRLFRGVLVGVTPVLTVDGARTSLTGYSSPGVLFDCTMPASAYPIQYRGLGLEEIARKFAEPFGLRVKVEGDLGGPFRRVKIKRDAKIASKLSSLAQQRQALVRSNPDGDLVLAVAPEVSTPVAQLSESQPPVKSVTPSFNPQSYYSHVTGVRVVRRGNFGGQHTVTNPRAQELGAIRPVTVTIKDTRRGELPKATEAAAGRMLASAATYQVGVVGWRDPAGDHWAPATTIQLQAPSVFVPEPYDFQVRSVTMTRSARDGDNAAIDLMLPGAFGGTPPSVLPWDA
jgi:prophage tail gpP-like protein